MRDINACAFTSFAFHPKAEMLFVPIVIGRSGRSSGLGFTLMPSRIYSGED